MPKTFIKLTLMLGALASLSGCAVYAEPGSPPHGGYYGHYDRSYYYDNHDDRGGYHHCPPGQHKKHWC